MTHDMRATCRSYIVLGKGHAWFMIIGEASARPLASTPNRQLGVCHEIDILWSQSVLLFSIFYIVGCNMISRFRCKSPFVIYVLFSSGPNSRFIQVNTVVLNYREYRIYLNNLHVKLRLELSRGNLTCRILSLSNAEFVMITVNWNEEREAISIFYKY